MIEAVRRYGVREQIVSRDEISRAAEDIRLVGFTVLDGGYSDDELNNLSSCFDRVRDEYAAQHGGYDALRAIDEHYTVRALLAHDRRFLDLARNSAVTRLCAELLGEYHILNQQNGIVNPPHGETYNQASFHRDLPYQHFTSSRPLAINALFCLDAFDLENGSTLIVPASHKLEAFPSDETVRKHTVRVTAPRGSFIVLDCMVYHSGGTNMTQRPRRAVNHVYTIPLMRQQIDLPSLLGDDFPTDSVTSQFLGYSVRSPLTVAAYIEDRRSRSASNSK
ncbi:MULTISPECIES: phytanoyl-CoA dioxygenase family protein [unclassified Aureimonas]|uniref:phytanoyl-CoA dioxygenase family protein n=1 Tax=unclassified Aureimonas TaxID=2615206 RepID=UPI0009E99622|nr:MULTISPECIES: phytanoyl-CoA dioxygenase family protein [unclassified Aureimonas]